MKKIKLDMTHKVILLIIAIILGLVCYKYSSIPSEVPKKDVTEKAAQAATTPSATGKTDQPAVEPKKEEGVPADDPVSK